MSILISSTLSQETILCVLSDLSMYVVEIGNGHIFDLDNFCHQYTNSEYALFYISPSLIQILPDSGKIQIPDNLTKSAPDFRLQLLPRNGPHFILRIYIRTDKNLDLAPWNIIFDQNSTFSLEILKTIFNQSFCVDTDKIEFEFEPNTAQVDLNKPVADQRVILNTTKIFLNVYMQEKAADYARRRTKIIEEIFKTEANYVNELDLVKEQFKEDFFRDLKIGDDVYRRTFKSIGEICPVHEQFLKALAPVGHAIESSVGRVFLQYYSLFKVASPHVCNFASANDEINELTHKSRPFANAVMKILQEHFNGKTIESLLVTPVQRLPRYPLLLRDLLKATSELHWDYMDIKNSLNNINKLVQDMDAKKREQDELNFVADLQAKIGNQYQVIKTGRKGLASIENIKTNNKGFKGSVYLFNDALLIWKSSPTEFLEESLTTVKLQKKNGFLIINDTYSIPEGKDTDSFCAKFLIARREKIMKLCSYGNALAWTKMEYGTGPELLAYTSITYYDDTMYLFGGKFPDDRPSNDLWMREEGRWKLVETIHTPSPRYGCSMSAFEGNLIVFGGQDGEKWFNDLLVYDINSRTWSIIDSLHKPSPRIGHTSVLVEINENFDDEYDDDISANFMSSNSDNLGNESDELNTESHLAQLWVFGGKTIEQIYTNDLYVFDFSVNQWFRFETPSNESPSPRAFGVSFLINDDKGNLSFAIQGGRDSNNAFNDLWAFDVIYKSGWFQPETRGKLPECRYAHVGGIINNNFYIIGGVDMKNESVPPYKLNMNEVPYIWENIPQCDEPETFIKGAATIDPNYGLIVFDPTIGYTTIRLSYNAENTLNCEKELSKEKKKIKSAGLTCTAWSRPFYNKKTNTVTMKIDSDEETDFVLPFEQKRFEHVWSHKNMFILNDGRTHTDRDSNKNWFSISSTSSFANDTVSQDKINSFIGDNDDSDDKLKDNISKNYNSLSLTPAPRDKRKKLPEKGPTKEINLRNSNIRKKGRRPSSLNISDSQELFNLSQLNNLTVTDHLPTTTCNTPNTNLRDSIGLGASHSDLIDFSALHSNPIPQQHDFNQQTQISNPNSENLINNNQKKKFLPVKKFSSNTNNSETPNKTTPGIFKGFSTMKVKKSKARDLFESSSKEETIDQENQNIDKDIFVTEASEVLHRSETSLANSYISNSPKSPKKLLNFPKPSQKQAKNDSSVPSPRDNLDDLIDFSPSPEKK